MERFLEEDMAQATVAYEGTVLFWQVAAEIIRYAEEKMADLIIIGTHGFKGLDRMLLGSVAEKIVKMAPCPVMTINAYRDEKGGKKR
jgi:nucleotide-binding universal stress UspA family protein